MNLLDPRLWVAAIIACGLAYGGGRWQQSSHDKAVYQAKATAAALDASRVQIKAVDDARVEEQRRTNEQARIANEATQQANAARADAVAAGDAADKLRKRIADLIAASRAPSNSATAGAGPGKPGGDPLDVLVDVLGRSDQTSGQLATYADQLRASGLACERSYDALMASGK
ncbi:DUF2514 family protein [Cupriavidus metallidurans]|uniref:DUF2514 family protein n=1 Tax=Cupriavidus metallidurans TaxID=119219 RepID=UPI000CE0337E|nr:DUF2514 family protein [Cupriavidus metallidurans]AVA33031.1 hypothetical protein C3Z06_04935 [Cupriavidus metallidurans]